MQLDLSLHITFTVVVRFQIPSSKEASHRYLDQLYIKLCLFYFFSLIPFTPINSDQPRNPESTSPLWRPDLKLLVYHKKSLWMERVFYLVIGRWRHKSFWPPMLYKAQARQIISNGGWRWARFLNETCTGSGGIIITCTTRDIHVARSNAE